MPNDEQGCPTALVLTCLHLRYHLHGLVFPLPMHSPSEDFNFHNHHDLSALARFRRARGTTMRRFCMIQKLNALASFLIMSSFFLDQTPYP